MLGRWSLPFLALPLLACGWADAWRSPKPIPENSLSLSAGRFGTFVCAEAPVAAMVGDMLEILCDEKGTPPTTPADPLLSNCIHANIRSDSPDALEAECHESSDVNGTPPTAQKLSLVVPHYHGPDTYTFEGSRSTSDPSLMVTVSDEWVESVPGGTGVPATQCTLVLTGPDTLQEGSFFTGHIRCTDMRAIPRLGGAGAAPPETAIVEGSFSVKYKRSEALDRAFGVRLSRAE